MAYYDGTKLLSLMDLDGNKPEVFICCGNRTAGKTFFFKDRLVRNFLQGKGKFIILYRFYDEVQDCANNFFKDLQQIKYQDFEMVSQARGKGIYQELFLNGQECGYACCLSSADKLKRFSSIFVDVNYIFLDEFQSETNHYCSNEIIKFRSIHTSVARGAGKQVRYVPVYMCSNNVSIINPYFSAMGVHKRLTPQVKFMRGNGWVLEQCFNQSASDAQLASGFNKAFEDKLYLEYSAMNKYLNDNDSFVDKLSSGLRYVCTLSYKGKKYGLWESQEGFLYVNTKIDPSYPVDLAFTTTDHQINLIMLDKNDLLIGKWRKFFRNGCFRFKDLECKNMILDILSYR